MKLLAYLPRHEDYDFAMLKNPLKCY